ncbi:MAG: hypothetical protein U5N58_08395 [Actinomycetota bacterium]|nr:hypothetical protein [Actinomycetota bacterium]
MIDWNISQGNLEEGDVTIESHSEAYELFEKYLDYKTKTEEDLKQVVESYNSGNINNKEEVKELVEQAKWKLGY